MHCLGLYLEANGLPDYGKKEDEKWKRKRIAEKE